MSQHGALLLAMVPVDAISLPAADGLFAASILWTVFWSCISDSGGLSTGIGPLVGEATVRRN